MSNLIIEVLLGLLTGVVGYVSYRGSTRAQKAQAITAKETIDAEAYERAKNIYESAIKALEGHIGQLREQTQLLDQEVARLQRSNIELQRSNVQLQEQVLEMQISNARLETDLRELREGRNE